MKHYIILIVVLMLFTSLACNLTGESPDIEATVDVTEEESMEATTEEEQIKEMDAEEVEEAVDTPTPIPPEPTTPPILMPQPGANFTGEMFLDISGTNGSGSSGELELVITEDGAAITSATLTVGSTRCSDGSVTIESGGWSSIMTPAQPAPINDGEFELSFGEIRITGQFTSPTEAKASINLVTKENVGPGSFVTCDFGTWTWTGTAN